MKFFCLKVYEDCLGLLWNKVNDNKRFAMRNGVLILLRNSHKFHDCKPIRVKIAKLVSEVAKRQFPQQWPDFFTDVITTWSTGPASLSEVSDYVY